jgi:O-methyltransferase involved in polyketide biosynthesis
MPNTTTGHQNTTNDHPTPTGRLSPTAAHPARVYCYWLGGKDHYPADRAAADEVARHRPQAAAGATANRAFLARAVRYLAAEHGIRQFLDIGTGLPAPGAAHQIAQQVDPACAVVYVDNDPLVLTYARALLTPTPPGRCAYVDADLRDTRTVLAQASRTLDFAQPAAVLLLAVLHFLPEADDPAGAVARLAAALAPGSFVVISHLTSDFAPGPVEAGVAAYNAAVATAVVPRTHDQVTALFGGLPLVAPGVVPVAEWRPTIGLPRRHTADLHAGIARIPHLHGGQRP